MTGFWLVDKPPGPSSHDMVARARKALGLKRVGHAGTLDPPASGLLVLGIGPATRLLSYVQRMPKTYDATVVLGVTTSTLDAAGEVMARRPVAVTEAGVREAAAALTGVISQRPPAVSAVKVQGERAYRRAARGETVQIQPRNVTVYELDVTRVGLPEVDLTVRCSAGTYVRSLVADLGEALECGAHVSSLRRTGIGHLDVAQASGEPVLLDPRDVLDLPCLNLDAGLAQRAGNGQRLSVDAPDGEVLAAGPAGVVGVFEVRAGVLKPVTVLGGDGPSRS